MTLAQRSGLHTAARAGACETVLAQARRQGLEQVRVAWADIHGTMRGKTLVCDSEATALQVALDNGVGMVGTVMLKDTSDRTAVKVFEPGAAPVFAPFKGAGNVLLLPDPASFTVLPWAPGSGWLRADPLWANGSAVQADPRGVLLRALALLQGAGYGLRCGLEVEFHIYRITDARLATDDAAWPAEPPTLQLIHPGYQLLSEAYGDAAYEALAIVRRTALGLGLPLRSLEIELGPSQVEAVFGATDALTAADHLLLFRSGVRQALRRAGYHASFVCRPPLPLAVASGWHLHHSLVSLGASSGANAMQREQAAGDADDARQVLSDVGAHWLAGLLEHAGAMTALCAPTVPAYSRYQGSVMAPQAVLWARDNRGALLRVLGAPLDPATRIENRLAEPLANPYLMMAAHIFAGLDGVQRQLQPPSATHAPYAARAQPLPASLGPALDALAANAVLQRGFGPLMAAVYDTVKRQELERHAAAEDKAQWERREYFGRF